MKQLPSALKYLFLAVSLHSALAAVSLPTAIQPDLTYQTGIVTIISSPLSSTATYPLNYNWAMSTDSLNVSLGVVGINFATSTQTHGFYMKVMSLNRSALSLFVDVNHHGNPLRYLRVSYIVSCNPYFDIGYVEYSFSTADFIQVMLTVLQTILSRTAFAIFPAEASSGPSPGFPKAMEELLYPSLATKSSLWGFQRQSATTSESIFPRLLGPPAPSQ